MPDQDRRAYTVREFSEHYRLSVARVYELLNEHKLNAVKCGGRTLILTAEAARFEKTLTPATFPALRRGVKS
jgi:hypothetical protein